jgi:uncharacterized membrane protein YdjX (TVP38/TMEM64 family)
MENLTAKTTATATPPAASKWKWAFWAVVIVALIAAGYFFHVQTLLKAALDWIRGLGVWGPVLFILIYIAACVFFIPGSVLTLGAGALFGVVKGSIYTSIGATLGASAAFLVGRYLARDWIAKKIAGNARFAAIDKAVADEGWKIVGLTRLVPVFPFTLLNYAFGLTRVSFRDYFFATWIGTMPGTIMYVYLGSIANAASNPTRTPAQWALFGVGLLAAVAVTVVITRIAKKALGRKISVS